MNKCIICNQEIKTDSQFINGNWYHNNCIELMAKQNKAYENMRKEAIEEIEYFELQAKHLNDDIYLDENLTKKLLNILNKVGGSDE